MSFRHCNEIQQLFDFLQSQPLNERKIMADAVQVSSVMLPDLFREALEYLEDPLACDDGELCTRDHCDEHAHGNGKFEDELHDLKVMAEGIVLTIKNIEEML